jgi:DEAD/DEAH box helicase domain-containing protein
LALMVASSAPLDQFVAQRPELMFDGSIEQARIDPDNTEILVQHLKCAAFELPFRHGESFADMPKDDTAAALGFLEGHGVVHASRGRYFWASDAFPANHVSLRSVGWDNFVIIDQDRELALAELDWHSTPTMLHEQAIYQHDGVQYQVERLDYDNHKAYVRKVEPDYFTTAMRHRKVTVIEREAESDYSCAPAGSNGTDAEAPPARLGWGEVNVVEKVVGYKKIKFHTHENAGYGDVRLPDIQKHTTSFWLTVERPVVEAMGRAAAVEGLRGVANALETVTSLALMCDPRDIGRSVGDAAPQPHALAEAGSSEAVRSNRPEDDDATFCVTAYLFDNVPGGVGLAERMYERATELLERAAELLGECDCPLGCPACVGATALAAAPPVPAGDGGTSLQAASVALPAITEGWTGDRKSAALELSRRLGLRRTPQADRAPSRVVAQR